MFLEKTHLTSGALSPFSACGNAKLEDHISHARIHIGVGSVHVSVCSFGHVGHIGAFYRSAQSRWSCQRPEVHVAMSDDDARRRARYSSSEEGECTSDDGDDDDKVLLKSAHKSRRKKNESKDEPAHQNELQSGFYGRKPRELALTAACRFAVDQRFISRYVSHMERH